MEFDIKAMALLFVMRTVIGSIVLGIILLGRQGFLNGGIVTFGGVLLAFGISVLIGQGLLKLRKWSWYATISLAVVYLFVGTTLFIFGDRPAAYEIGLDSAMIVYLYIRRPVFHEPETKESFLEQEME